MQADSNEPTTVWYLRPKVQRGVWIALLAVLVVEAVVAIWRKENDFRWHITLGEAFQRGTPYVDGGDWYPPARAMFDAVLAMFPYRLARAACFGLAVLGLANCFRLWRQMGDAQRPLPTALWNAAGLGTALLLLPYLLRDLDECGLQLLLLFLLSAGAAAVVTGRPVQGGFWLAVATSYKSTPLICLPLLVWKRQWRAAACMLLFLPVLNLGAPALLLGWQGAWDANAQWLERAAQLAAVDDPTENGVEAPKTQNQGLEAALARYLVTYPEGHRLHIEHAAFVQFGDLSAEQAHQVVQGVLLALAAALAWRMRGRWLPITADAARAVPGFRAGKMPSSGLAPLGGAGAPRRLGWLTPTHEPAPEWAAVCILCALLSPICWKQHLVLALPGLLLVLRTVLVEWALPATARGVGARVRLVGVVAVAVAAIVSRHGIVGREMSIVLMSYKVDTAAVLLVMLLALTLPPASMLAQWATSIAWPAATAAGAAERRTERTAPLAWLRWRQQRLAAPPGSRPPARRRRRHDSVAVG